MIRCTDTSDEILVARFGRQSRPMMEGGTL